jgi:tetratricopeptide (TPR) repeat protein
MTALRWLLALLVVAASVAAIARLVVPRIACNREKGRIQADAIAFGNMGDDYERTVRARRNVEVCRRCLDRIPSDYEMWFLLAVNQRVLQQRDEALQSFRQALSLNERPETYAEIAVLELERGNVDLARELLVRATRFNLTFSEYVSPPFSHEIYAEAMAKQKELQQRRR